MFPRAQLSGLSFPKCRDAGSLGRLAAAVHDNTFGLDACGSACRLVETVKTRWQQLVCTFLLASGRCAARLSYRDGRRLVSRRSCADSALCAKSRSVVHVNGTAKNGTAKNSCEEPRRTTKNSCFADPTECSVLLEGRGHSLLQPSSRPTCGTASCQASAARSQGFVPVSFAPLAELTGPGSMGVQELGPSTPVHHRGARAAGAAAPDVRPRCHGVPVLCGVVCEPDTPSTLDHKL